MRQRTLSVAAIQFNFFSETLQLASSMNVLLPRLTASQRAALGADHRFPVLFLLHGMSDDHTGWTRYTAIERYTRYLNLAVVMPAVDRSYYTDMKQGLRYWRYISEEVPEVARFYFPLASQRAASFVAGLSMGGYGAFKLAFRHPERYAYAASFSGALDMVARFAEMPQERQTEYRWIFGSPEELRHSEDDLVYLAEQLARSRRSTPQFYLSCGTEDFLYENNLNFRNHMQALGLDLVYDERPGEHEWDYWDMQIEEILQWLPVRSIEETIETHPNR